MEIPYMIMHEVKRLEHNEKMNSICDIYFNINNSSYNLKIYIGKDNFITIETNGIKFKCIDKEKYEYLLKYFIEYIINQNGDDTMYKIEWNDYHPDDDENYNKIFLNVKSNNQFAFIYIFNDMNDENIINDIKECLLPFYYITI